MATFDTFTGNGTKVFFDFTFEYLEQSDVKVSLNGTTQPTTAYFFSTDTRIQFNTISVATTLQETTGAPKSGVTVRVFRETDITELKSTFFAGSAIRSQDLNDNFNQNNFAVEEVRDQYVTKTNGEFDTNVDMNSNRITELADPVNAQDAVTKQYLEDNYFDDGTETILSGETWPGNDTTIATTQAIDNRVDSKVDTAIEGDILVNATGLTKSASGGQVTLGIGANSVDLDRIKNDDIITYAEQPTVTTSDNNIFTASAAERQFDTLVQLTTPSGSDWEVGKTWLQNDIDKTLSIWNGSTWVAVASGGSFTELSKVIYVDSVNGDDTLAGHRISNPKRTIKAAMDDINGDANGDGSIILVAPGIYGETFPIDIQKNDIAVVGSSLRNCIIHPAIPAADQAGYSVDTPEANELQTMFRVNSGTYLYGLTLQGMKASGSRGGNSLDTDSTYGLPTNQGWNFAFYPGATIKKSPYIQNCTNFSDSQINNVNFTPHSPGEGAAGDLDSGPSGGGILIDGNVPADNSPLRSMVCDSYTHTALDGPGIFVTNNGYCQATSSYSFFNHFHLKTKNGGQANLAASTTDFGSHSLIADGRSPYAIFTATTTASASDGSTTFTIGAPTARTATPLPWHGSETRPQDNMLVDIGGNTYPILSAVAAGSGWTVTVSRPDPTNLTENLGLNGAVSSGAAVSFYLRSMIASSGHTMEYVGSGTDYRALPENGGVPDDTKQTTELNNGKIWAAITDHRGKFTVGSTFSVDQQTGVVSIAGEASDTVRKSAPTGSAILPSGSTAQRDASPNNGFLRYNTTTNEFEGYQNGAWGQVGGSVEAVNDLSDGVTNSSGATIGLGTGALANDDGTTNNNTAVGKDALNANTSGAHNVAVGYLALDANTTGAANMAIGNEALGANTTGSHNTALGYLSLESSSTSSANVAVGNYSLRNTTNGGNAALGYAALQANTSGTRNVAVGYAALNANTTANDNTAVGYDSLKANTTGSSNTAVGRNSLVVNTTGSSNVSVGESALDANTTGSHNIAAGKNALGANTSGQYNVAVGGSALSNNTTATRNTAVGYNALGANTTGGNNTAVGYVALDANTTGANNTAFGDATLTAATTASSNTALGRAALNLTTTGSYNTGVGASALEANTTAPYNTAVGYQALKATTTGGNNVAVGRETLKTNTIGTHNVAIGSNALDALTTSSANIAIGTNSLTTNTTGASNVAIGYDALNSNETGSTNVAIGRDALKTSTGSHHVAIGANALDANTTGAQNTAVGKDALGQNTTAENSVAVGYQALAANTTGSRNSAFGAYSLDVNTTGVNNVAVGQNTLGSNTTASFNTAVGWTALSSNTTGINNVALGANALDANTTQHNNTAVGYRALTSQTIADQNTAVGADSLYSNTTGEYNTAQGFMALYANTTANLNTAIGYQTLRLNSTGTQNVAVGAKALDANTTANNNVAVGYDSMGANTTGAYNVAVGYQALDANETGTQNVAIGSSALGANTANYNVAVGKDAASSNTTGTNNVAVGTNALDANTTASNNTALGYFALYANTTGTQNTSVGTYALDANTTANQNTAVGYVALGANSTGHTNSAVGHSAIDANTTGIRLTAFGHNALGGNTTGSNSTAIGTFALQNQTTASNNTAVGYSAMLSNIDGTFNTAIGHEALYNNTGSNNTALGYISGRANTSGENNIYVGKFSGRGGTTGSRNVCLGNETLETSGTGDDNTAVGHNALTNATPASDNTAVGSSAAIAVTTGLSNTCIGKSAGATINSGNDNICIGRDTDVDAGGRARSITIGIAIDSVGENYFTFGKTDNRVYNNFSSNASWARSSDVRLKKDIQTNTDLGLDFINDLRTVTYKWKAPSELDSTLPAYNPDKTEADYTNKMYGFIAQEVKQALDDHNVTDFAGWTTDNEDIQGISYEMFVMPLVKAVQELSAKNTALEARIAALEAA